jgi:hypothetical protein
MALPFSMHYVCDKRFDYYPVGRIKKIGQVSSQQGAVAFRTVELDDGEVIEVPTDELDRIADPIAGILPATGDEKLLIYCDDGPGEVDIDSYPILGWAVMQSGLCKPLTFGGIPEVWSASDGIELKDGTVVVPFNHEFSDRVEFRRHCRGDE